MNNSTDERWYTPRAQASTGRSSVQSFGTPRGSENLASTYSESDYYTPRWDSNHQGNSTQSQGILIPPQRAQRYSQMDIPRNDMHEHVESRVSNADADIFSLTRHGRVEEVDSLLLRGIHIDDRDHYGNAILHISCQNGNKKLMKLALRYGANIDICNFKGNTAMHFAYRYGYANTLGSYLQRKGANPTLQNLAGEICTDLGGTER